MSKWDTDINLLLEDLQDLKRGLDGEEVEGVTWRNFYNMTGLDVYLNLDDMSSRLTQLQHSIIHEHLQRQAENEKRERQRASKQ